MRYFMALCFLAFPFTMRTQPVTNQPVLLDCGQQGAVQVICGTRAPEDLEVTPDGRYLIVAIEVNDEVYVGSFQGSRIVKFSRWCSQTFAGGIHARSRSDAIAFQDCGAKQPVRRRHETNVSGMHSFLFVDVAVIRNPPVYSKSLSDMSL
jgi:hypothetical protein